MTLTHSGDSELAQLIGGTTAGAMIPEIVRRGFQDLLEAVGEAFSEGIVSAAIGATRHERCPDERSTHRNGYLQPLLTTQVTEAGQLLPRLARASPPGGQGSLSRGDGGLHRRHFREEG
jgi:putative transposase